MYKHRPHAKARVKKGQIRFLITVYLSNKAFKKSQLYHCAPQSLLYNPNYMVLTKARHKLGADDGADDSADDVGDDDGADVGDDGADDGADALMTKIFSLDNDRK